MKERLKKPGRPSLPMYGTLFVICLVLLVVIFQPTFFSHAQSTQEAAPWNGNFVAYQVGDVVSYDHNTYQCLQAHTSEPNWNPHDTAALWQLQSAESTPVSNNATPVSDNTTPLASNPTPVGSSVTPLDANPTPVNDNATPVSSNPTPIVGSTNNSGKLATALGLFTFPLLPHYDREDVFPSESSIEQRIQAFENRLQTSVQRLRDDEALLLRGDKIVRISQQRTA